MPATLSGMLSRAGMPLRGELSTQPPYQPYEEETYEVIPKPYSQTLKTANKVLKEDIVIAEIPYFETTNPSQGLTVYIATEV